MAFSFRSLVDGAKRLAISGSASESGPAPLDRLFDKTKPAVDGEDCLHDCDACTVKYPKNFKVNMDDTLYGLVAGWSTHMLVATGKTDWVRSVADEKGSIMEAVDKAKVPSNGKLMLSASNIPTPSHVCDYTEPTTVLLLPAFVIVDHVTPDVVPALLENYVSRLPTNATPMASSSSSSSLPPPPPSDSTDPTDAPLPPMLPPSLSVRPSPHSVLVLLCSQRTRDARCGQSAPLLRKELERHLRPLGLYRDLDDERPGGVGIYFISHVGGHKYSANVMIYRRPDPFGLDGVPLAGLSAAERDGLAQRVRAHVTKTSQSTNNTNNTNGTNGSTNISIDGGAAQCLWLARIFPEDCENLVRYTILQGKVVKPESQLRAGFDRSRGLLSW